MLINRCDYTLNKTISPRLQLIEVLMIKNKGYWLLIIDIEMGDRLKLIKSQMNIF